MSTGKCGHHFGQINCICAVTEAVSLSGLIVGFSHLAQVAAAGQIALIAWHGKRVGLLFTK